MDTNPLTHRLGLASALSVAAGLVHAAAAGTHSDIPSLVVLFSLTATAQSLVGVVVLMHPRRAALVLLAVANLGAVVAWTLSRTVGLPVLDSLAAVQPVGTQDLAAALLAAGAAASAASVLVHPVPTGRPRLAWAPALVLLPALVGVAAPHDAHTHGAGHTHGDGPSHDTDPAHPAHDTTALTAHVALAGLDTGHATEAELTEAIDLVERTRAAVVGRYEDVAAAEADGFVWIGDGRAVGRYQHYVNPARLVDGRTLDATAIESLVYENTPDGPVLVSTMYLLERGATMDDVPQVAGDLTVWHDHRNLCFDASGVRLAGVSTDGRTCTPGGTLQVTPPMLHVWVTDHPCGPFAGIEGHGAGTCEAGHGH